MKKKHLKILVQEIHYRLDDSGIFRSLQPEYNIRK